jgi:hypothetical protein
MQATNIILTVLINTLKFLKINEFNFNELFYLSEHIQILSFEHVINIEKYCTFLHLCVHANSVKSITYFTIEAFFSLAKPHFRCSKARRASGFHITEQCFIF